MDFYVLSTGRIHFEFKGFCVVFYNFIPIKNTCTFCKQTVQNLIRRHVKKFGFPWVETSTWPGGFMICVWI